MIRISVCLAYYEGERYIFEQLNSILNQIEENDEIIIVDDASKNSLNSIWYNQDSRITILTNSSNLGHVKTFEKAIAAAQGEYIFLSDQDDVWLPNRVNGFLSSLSNNPTTNIVIASNFVIENSLQNKSLRSSTPFHFLNLLYMILGNQPYYGCCMAFNRGFKQKLLPFPKNLNAHDHWIAVLANVGGAMLHLEIPTLSRRIHHDNLTYNGRPLVKKILYRFTLLRLIFVAIARIYSKKKTSESSKPHR